MNRRGFIGSILALGAAPAIVRAESLMRCSGIVIPTTETVWAINNAPREISALDILYGWAPTLVPTGRAGWMPHG